MVLRALVETARDDVEIVLINTPGPVETSAHLYEFDSIHGRARGTVSHGEGWMDVARRIAMTHERDPAMIAHADHDVDIVLDVPAASTAVTPRRASCRRQSGSVSAPARMPSATIVYGVNHAEIAADQL